MCVSLALSHGDGLHTVVLVDVVGKESAGGPAEAMGDHECLVGVEGLEILNGEFTTTIDIRPDVHKLRVIPHQASPHMRNSRNLMRSRE